VIGLFETKCDFVEDDATTGTLSVRADQQVFITAPVTTFTFSHCHYTSKPTTPQASVSPARRHASRLGPDQMVRDDRFWSETSRTARD
jgi:hypothetical protein